LRWRTSLLDQAEEIVILGQHNRIRLASGLENDGICVTPQQSDDAGDGWPATVLDTGSSVQGRSIDLYIPDCGEAIRFGRQSAQVPVLRRGP
jgi:3D (Asp-Asp-Asp) domain-containing protein